MRRNDLDKNLMTLLIYLRKEMLRNFQGKVMPLEESKPRGLQIVAYPLKSKGIGKRKELKKAA